MVARIFLNGQTINYTIRYSKCNYIGLKVDRYGLIIRVPFQTPLSDVEAVLQEKSNWIIKKLEHWENKESLELTWTHDAVYPLLGKHWRIAMKSSGEIYMTQQFSKGVLRQARMVQLLAQLNPYQIEKFVMAWYDQQAISCFKERIVVYARKLNICLPQFRLSRARTRWGSCNARGIIYLNWRLIQVPLHLIDYVVAHELSHLIEMNHSTVFWKLVESVCPDYREARTALKEYV